MAKLAALTGWDGMGWDGTLWEEKGWDENVKLG